MADPFVAELASGVHELRGALTELLSTSKADPSRPLALSRALKVDKSLAWKVSNIIKSAEVSTAVQYLPGPGGFAILLNAVERRGVSTGPSIERARRAMQAIDAAVARHAGDRPTLELVLDSLPTTSAEPLLRSRKLAFRGNSGIWGVQAKTRVNTAIVAPSDDQPGFVHRAIIGGWIDFRRLRADTPWALFRRWVTTHLENPALLERPIDPQASPEGPMLIREFCSDTLPPIRVTQDPNGEFVHELGPGPVGNTGAFTCFFGSLLRNIGSRYASDTDDRGEFAAVISAPVEALQFDLIVHRECSFALRTRVDVYGGFGARHARDLLPLDVRPIDLGRFPPVVESTLVPRYGQMIDHVLARCGWQRRDFAAMRYVLEYPPFPSQVVVSFPLESRESVR